MSDPMPAPSQDSASLWAAIRSQPASGEDAYLGPVREALNSTAFFSLFSVPNPDLPTTAIPAVLPWPISLLQRIPFLQQFLLAGIKVHESPHRYVTHLESRDGKLLAVDSVGAPIATVAIHWAPIPWDYSANPTGIPPQTILNPISSQRFEMLDGQFRFDNTGGSGFHGFGAGRTFPALSPAGPHLRIGAVIDILEGFGQLEGFRGTVVVNGRITPPNALNLNLMVRVLDPTGKFQATGPLSSLEPNPDPDPTATFMMFAGDPDPDRPSEVVRDAQGTIIGLRLVERLRKVEIDFDTQSGLQSRVEAGELVGSVRSTLHLTPQGNEAPLALQSTDTVLDFTGSGGVSIGSVQANLIEGRAFPTELDGVPRPILRVGGFGPFEGGGTGWFAGAEGMLSVNGALSLFPATSSNLYVLRLIDPDQKFRAGSGIKYLVPTYLM